MDKILKIGNHENASRYAIGDIHGCFKTLKNLIEEKLKLSVDDQLFLLGDYIDRGPAGKEVLDYIIDLKTKGFSVFPLRGNHEQNLLEACLNYKPKMFKFFVEIMNKNKGLIDDDLRLKNKYRKFLNELPYLYELDNFYLVHAGLNLSSEYPFNDFNAMITIRKKDFSKDELLKLKGKRVVHGHQVTEIQDIISRVSNKTMIIPIDNGCVYTKKYRTYDSEKLGKLCALNLDSFELINQENIDQKK